jgi:hypothetical protein
MRSCWAIVWIWLLIGCSAQGSLHPPQKTAILNPVPNERGVPSQGPTSCISFRTLEHIARNWQSGQIIRELQSFGYDFIWASTMAETHSIEFKNKETSKELIMTRNFGAEGELFVKIHYDCTPAQLTCFEDGIDSSLYTPMNTLYKKKGTGSYAYQTILIDRQKSQIVFTHFLGKELSMPNIPSADSIPFLKPGSN